MKLSVDQSLLPPILLAWSQTDVDQDTPNDDDDELHPDGAETITDQRQETGEVRFLPLFENNSSGGGEQLSICNKTRTHCFNFQPEPTTLQTKVPLSQT